MSSIGSNAGRNVFQQSLASMAKQAATAAAKGADKGAPKSKAISRKQGVARHLATQAGKAAVRGAAEGTTKRTDPVVRFANGAVDTVGVANGVDTVLGAGAKAIKDLTDGARLPWAVSKTTAPADGILQTSKNLDKKTSIGYISDRAKELSKLTKGDISRGLVTPEQRADAKYVVRQLAELKLLGLDGADRGKVAQRLRGVARNLVLMNRSPILDGFDKAMMIHDYLNVDTTSDRDRAVHVAPTEPPLMTR